MQLVQPELSSAAVQVLYRVLKEFTSKKLFGFYRFLRKGKAGSYRDDLNMEQIQKLDDWAKEAFKSSDFEFKE